MWISPDAHKIVGACLEVARKAKSVTQADLAKRLGKPQSFVSSYERGQRRVDVLELLAITAAIGTDAKELFGEIIARAMARRGI